MSFFKKIERSIIKSGIYGFVLGLFIGILTIPNTEVMRTERATKIFNELSLLEYIIKLLRISVIGSVCLIIITVIYLYMQEKRKL